jgi:hypothetical protein
MPHGGVSSLYKRVQMASGDVWGNWSITEWRVKENGYTDLWKFTGISTPNGIINLHGHPHFTCSNSQPPSHTPTHTHIYMHTHTHMHTPTHTHIHWHTHMQTHTMYWHIHKHTHWHMRTHTRTHTDTRAHTQAHAPTCARTHKFTHKILKSSQSAQTNNRQHSHHPTFKIRTQSSSSITWTPSGQQPMARSTAINKAIYYGYASFTLVYLITLSHMQRLWGSKRFIIRYYCNIWLKILGKWPTWRTNSFQCIYLFTTLYMFRAHRSHHQDRQIVLIQFLVTVTPCWWQCRVLAGGRLVW